MSSGCSRCQTSSVKELVPTWKSFAGSGEGIESFAFSKKRNLLRPRVNLCVKPDFSIPRSDAWFVAAPKIHGALPSECS